MRLVDANMAPIYLNSSACEQIKRMPIVEAIPVEWIEQYIRSADTHDEKRALRKMCMQWEKEKSVKISEGNYDSDEEYKEQMRCLDED